jgi:hypothetical protein
MNGWSISGTDESASNAVARAATGSSANRYASVCR